MRIINSVDLDFSLGVAEVEFFKYFIVLLNELCSLNQYVRFIPSILLLRVIPKCLPEETHGKGLPQRYIGGRGLSFRRKAMHFVLHFLGFGSVLNLRLWELA